MTQKDMTNRILNLFNCSISSPEAEHLCENPLMLSCGHYICKDCLQPNVSHSTVKCNTCGKQNEKDLNQKEEQVAFQLFFEQNINELSKVTLENFHKVFKKCKDMIYQYEERIDNHIQFTKDTILLRIESIKNELDYLYNIFEKELDEIGKKWKLESKDTKFNDFDTKIFESELNKLGKSINENKNINQENIYKYQKQIKQIQQIIKEYNDNSPSLEFKESEEKLSKKVIGELIFDINYVDIDKEIRERIKMNKVEQMNVQCSPWDLCELPNGNILLSNYGDANLQLYDANLQLLKTVNSINGNSYNIIGVASDENNNFYMCAFCTHFVIKTDANFNQLAIFGTGTAGNAQNQVNNPSGICFYNQSVYVCDRNNKRFLKLNSNLNFQASYPFDYFPMYIKNINNVAILRTDSKLATYFYDLNTFDMLKKYEGHNGIIGTSKNYFYEYYSINKTLYCYNSNGELVDQIQTNGLTSNDYNTWGSLCVFKTKLLLTNYNSIFLTNV